MIRPVALLLALLPAAGLAHSGHDHAAPMESALTQESLLLPDIPVTDTRGDTAGFVSRYGDAGPVLISFIYTECEDNCTMVKAVMKLVDDDLQAPDAPPLRLIAVSVDPWRDTPASLAATAAEIEASDNWDWLVANRADTPVLLSAFGLQPGPVEAHESVYLLGDLRSGEFWRISGVPDPALLIEQARGIAP
ncbi:SCO family protein [uncultured Paracoccus sp.]|uniref:SCO family protein n=1 Tax=uncultured Paracoccus sp. TaxID=189685 RepID=UPI0025D887CF|nr:SCO family protein [uncultured Paracoccus sp.]